MTSIREAEQYTRGLATTHYENFHVVSFLLPKRLHQDFYNIYAYCRSADDLADEIPDTSESLRQLKSWGEQLDRMYEGEAEHQDKSGEADYQRERDLRQSAEAQRCEELRSGAVADGENEQAEENCLENRRNDEVTELADDHGHYQGTSGGAD